MSTITAVKSPAVENQATVIQQALSALGALRKDYEPGSEFIERSKAIEFLGKFKEQSGKLSVELREKVSKRFSEIQSNKDRNLYQWKPLYLLMNEATNELIDQLG